MSNQELLDKIKNYINKGLEQSLDFYKEGLLLMGKISAYNDVYGYIENVLEEEVKLDVRQ